MFNILKSRKNKDLFDKIYKLTDKICKGKDITFSTRCYLIFHGMKDFPECSNKNCHNKVIENINSFKTGFHRFCSVKCASESEITKEKIGKTKTEKYGCSYFNNYEKSKRTNLERYGVEHTFQTENNREKAKITKLEKYGDENFINVEKMKETNLERYGNHCPLVNPEIHEKRMKAMLERYGVEYSLQSDEIRDKMKKTCLELYGDENYCNTEQSRQTKLEKYGDEFFNNREKAKNTCLSRYGVDSYCSTEECRQKIYETCMKRYGVPSYMSTEEFRRKSEETCMEKYGVCRYANSEEFSEVLSERHSNYFFEHLMTLHETRPLFGKEELKWRCRDKQLKWRCCRCGQEFYSKIDHSYANMNGYVSYARCPVCDIRLYVKSYAELELFDSIRQIYHGDLISGDRKTIRPKEIDIMMKDISTGIEYDGIFWHSEYVGVNANKMLEKTLMCDTRGIRLIRVYSDEWLTHKESVLWKIKTLISDDVHEFGDIKIVRDLDHRMMFCGKDKIGEYFLCGDFIDRIVLGEKDLNIDFLRCIVNYEKTFGVAITSFVFDRRFYSINKIARLSAKVEVLAQTRYVVHGDSMRDGVGGMRTDVRTHIWDCGYIKLIM